MNRITPALGNDRGALRLVTITKLVVVLAILGVLGFDGFALMSNHVKCEDDAQNAAYAASEVYYQTKNLEDAYQAAVAYIATQNSGETVLQQGFAVDPDGTIHLEVQRSVHTLVFSHIGPLKQYTTTIQHGDANYEDD